MHASDGTPPPENLSSSLPAPHSGPHSAIDNYRLGNPLARGGMGSVLEAQDEKLKRTVAVKVMLFDAAIDPALRQRFLREAEVLAMLAHPNIVPIHDIVWENGQPLFYTMKLIRGRTLQAVLNDLRRGHEEARREWSLSRLLMIFRKICDAIAFAHSKGVLHRDLKPENVMVGEFGEVLVMDWGLAKRMKDEWESTPENFKKATAIQAASSADATLHGTVIGTPHYMSPEQAKGQIDPLDERSDIFSLGGILYALLTLRPPVEGESVAEVLRKVSSAEITPPLQIASESSARKAFASRGAARQATIASARTAGGRVQPALSAVAMKALALDKARRYQSVAELASEIEAFQNGFSTAAERAGLGRQLALLIRRHKGMFTTAAGAWLLIVVFGIWFITNLRSKEQRATAGEASAVRETESARRSLAKAKMNLADAAFREGHGPDMQAALRDVPEDLRDSTWRHLFAASDTSIARLNPGPAPIHYLAAHPRMSGVFVVADNRPGISLIEVRTGKRHFEFVPQFSSPGSTACRLAISPDGERIAVARRKGDGIAIHGATDGRKLAEWPAPASHRLEFSSNGTLLLQTDAARTRIALLDAATGDLQWEYAPKLPQGLACGTFTPEGDRVFVYSPSDGFRVLNVEDGSVLKSFSARDRGTAFLAMGRNGLAAAGDWNGFVHILDLNAGAVTLTFRASNLAIAGIGFTPSGREIVTVVEESDGRQSLHVWDVITSERRSSLLGGIGPCQERFSLHSLSGELVIGGGEIRVWNMASPPEKWLLQPDSYGVSRPAFWGSDDLIICAGTGAGIGLHELLPGGSKVRWVASTPSPSWSDATPNGNFAAIAWGGNENGAVLLRNPGPQPEVVARFKTSSFPSHLRISPAGDRIAIIERYRSRVDVHETTAGQRVPIDLRDVKRVWMVAWLNGGQWLAGQTTVRAERGGPGSEERIIVWDAATGAIVRSLETPTRLEAIAAAPDGKRFAEGGADKMVRLRDSATLTVLQEFRAHDGPLTAMAWHPFRPILATTSADLTIRIWDLETGKRLEEMRWMQHPPLGLVFSPSGRRLACDNTCIWEPPSLGDPAEGNQRSR